jgi:hypothetical protein
MTDVWDPSIPSHKALAHEIEFGNGIPEMRPLSGSRKALQSVGFIIEHEEDLAERPDEVPWYYPLEGDIRKAQTFWDYFTVWRMSGSGRFVTHNAMRLMEILGLLPKGTWEVGEALKVAADALVKGGQTKVRTRFCTVLVNKTLTAALALHSHVFGHMQETVVTVKSRDNRIRSIYRPSNGLPRPLFLLSYCESLVVTKKSWARLPGIFRNPTSDSLSRPTNSPPRWLLVDGMSTPGPVESRVSKPRLPKAYTKEQLVFLRSNLDEFERKSQGFVRGDAKKFALEKAGEFILTFGLPSDVETGPDVDTEAKFKEVSHPVLDNAHLGVCLFHNHCP